MFLNYVQLKKLLTKTFFIRFFILTFVFTHVFLIIQNYSFFTESIRLGFGLPYAYTQLFDVENTFSTFAIFIASVSILLSAFNISLMWEYMQIQIKLQSKIQNSLHTKHNYIFGFGTILAVLGTHCVSCVAVLFGGLLSVSVLSVLPFGGNEIGLIGIMILLYTTYITAKKLQNPYVC